MNKEMMQDSGVEWIGAVPKTWKIDRLKDIANINENSLDAKTPNDYVLKYIEISNVNSRGIISEQAIEEIEFASAPSRARRIVSCGNTIISSVRPNLQAIAYICIDDPKLVCSTGFYVVVTKQPYLINQRFLYFCLLSENSKQYFESVAKGVGYPAVDDKEFKTINLALPAAAEQQIIAQYLEQRCGKLDAIIAIKQQQIKTLDALRQSIIYQAVTKGLDASVPLVNSGVEWLGEIPINWKTEQIKRRCELLRGKFSHRPRNDPAFYDGDYPFVQTGDVTSANKYIKTYSQTLNELGLSVSKIFPRKTLVMTIAANVGDVAILDFDACFPDSMVGLVPNHHTNLDFLYYLMLAMRGVLLRSAILSIQLNLNNVQIGTNFAPFPPISEQKNIAAHLDQETQRLDQLKTNLTQQIATLEAYKKSLIYECVTGKKRITADALSAD